MTKLFYLALILPTALCWVDQKSHGFDRKLQTRLNGQTNPCWQDLYDDDCSMDMVYQASFVASHWLKGLPCAAGLEVRIIMVKEEINFAL